MSKSVNESHRGLAGNAADAELMAALHATGGEALGALLRRYTRLVHRVASGILRDAGEAEDVTQEVFFEIYRKAHLYDPARGSVRVWLLQYAYHRSLRRRDALRRRAAWRGESLDVMEVRPIAARSVSATSVFGVGGCGVGVRGVEGLSPDECRWVIRAGLAELPPRQRLTLELACFHGLTLADVAAHLRVSLGSARHYYYRGLARLRLWARRTTPSHSSPGAPRTTSAASIDADEDEPERQPGVEVRRI
jgi:RNA polymerase sigma-70 factor (ECF subfamily)